jgi:hypothetical protein
MKTLSIILALIVLLYWWSGDSSAEMTLYNATCNNDIKIYPSTYWYTKLNSTEAFKRDRSDRDNCIILPLNRKRYILNEIKGEVYYKSAFGNHRLINCAIVDDENWTCEYPDDASELQVVIGGLEARANEDMEDERFPNTFSLRRWQWFFANIHYWYSGDGPSDIRLIPEQEVAL